MYTTIERRKLNPETEQKTMQRGSSDYLPKLQAAAGFVGFYLVNDEANGINTAITVWESKGKADQFSEETSSWTQTLDESGHTLQSDNRGETLISLEHGR